MSPFRRQDHQIECLCCLELQPIRSALTCRVGSLERLRHQTLMTRIQRAPQKPLGFVPISRDDPWNQGLERNRRGEELKPLPIGEREKRRPVQIETIKKSRCQRGLPPHRDLKRLRGVTGRARAHSTISGRRSRSPPVKLAGENLDHLIPLVDLKSRPVELELKASLAEPLDRLIDRIGWSGRAWGRPERKGVMKNG